MPRLPHTPRLRLTRTLALLTLAACLSLAGCSLGQATPTVMPTRPVASNQPVVVSTTGTAAVSNPEINPLAADAVVPTLSIPQHYPAVQWRDFDLPINFTATGHSISSISFTLEYDSNRLYFDNRDLNNDGLPDTIQPVTASGFALQFRYEPQGATSRLVIAISDLIAPIRAIPSGTLLKIRLLPKAAGNASVLFTSSPPVVYRDLQFQVIPGQSFPGSVEIFQGNWLHHLPFVIKQVPKSYSIRGRVTENGIGRPGVVLQVQTGQIAWSDANGNYLIDKLPKGLYTLLAILPNTRFNPPSRVINLPPDVINQNFAVLPPVVVPTPTVPRPPTPTPSGTRCEERIFNGSFETTGGWIIPSTSFPAAYVTSPVFNGQRSMRTGIPNTSQNRVSSSWVFQEFVIPFNVSSAVLKLHVFPKTGEPSMSSSADRQTVRLLDQNNTTLANLVGPMLGNQGYWMFYQFDLRNFTGRAMRLAFETYNDGIGSVTWMFADQVSLVVCY